MKPRLHNRICAHPMAICCFVGTLTVWIQVTNLLYASRVFPTAFFDVQRVPSLLAGYACLAGLGSILGAFFFGFVAPLCARVNGGPYVVGDRVMILTGPLAGTIAKVHEVSQGSGGYQPSAWVYNVVEGREKYSGNFDCFALLRMSKRGTASDDTPSDNPVV